MCDLYFLEGYQIVFVFTLFPKRYWYFTTFIIYFTDYKNVVTAWNFFCVCVCGGVLKARTLKHIKKQWHCFSDNCPYSQSYVFSSGHVWMWGLDYKEGWGLKNWYFWNVVLEKTLESPLDTKEVKLVNSKGIQSWLFIGRTDAEAEAPVLATWCDELIHWKRS